MLRLALACVLGILIVSPSIAQESNKKYFYNRQECYPAVEFIQMIMGWDEKALFTGNGITLGVNGDPYSGAVMFFVNQDTGSWTLGTAYADGNICITAAGSLFEPYTE